MSRLGRNGRTKETSSIKENANDGHTKQLRSTTYMGKVYKNFFKVCLREYGKPREFIKQENEKTRHLLKELITTVKDTSSESGISQLETSAMIVSKLYVCHCDSMKLVKETISQMNRYEFREDIATEKRSLEKTRNEKYKSRNDLFCSHHHNKSLEQTYNSELLKKNPCIPRKFLPNSKR